MDELLNEHEQGERVRSWLQRNALGLIGGIVAGLALREPEQVELLDLGSANIRVAEYLDKIPDMKLLRAQLHRSVLRAREQAAAGALPHVVQDNGEEA